MCDPRQVEIDGTGVACATGSSEGSAVAAALLRITLDVTIGAVAEKFGEELGQSLGAELEEAINSAEASSSGEAISAALAEAYAAAFSEVCTTGGPVRDAQQSVADQAAVAYGTLFGRAAIRLCQARGFGTDGVTFESTELTADADINGTVAQDVVNFTEGNAAVGGSQPVSCEGTELE
ncbi:unnamed protein product, partial [Ostreobium quekettii]